MSIETPWLSVVMPVHNGGHWLTQALESIERAQHGAAIEVIIRDSTPEHSCESLVDPFRTRLAIDYAYQPEIPSWTRKTNLGVEAARSPFACTLHQDDLWTDDRIRVLQEMVDRYPDAAMYVTSAQIVDGASKVLGKWRPPLPEGQVEPAQFRDAMLVQNSIAIPSPIFRRDHYLKVGGLDESLWYTPDWDLWFKLGGAGPVVFDRRITSAFRIHGSAQTMRGNRQELEAELTSVLEKYLEPSSRTARISRASAKINSALAYAAAGHKGALGQALRALILLGPIDGLRYLYYSRFVERVLPRVRERLRGTI